MKKINEQNIGGGKKKDNGRKRRMIYGSYSVVLSCVVIVAVLLVNICLQYLGENVNLQIDMTQNQVYSITNKTNEVVSSLDEDVYIYTLFSGSNVDQTLQDILNRYKPLSDHIKVENVDPILNPGFVTIYSESGVAPSTGDVVVTNADKNVYRVIDYDDMYTYDDNDNLSQVNVESKITSAITYVTDENRKSAYILTGHGEPEIATMTSFNEILEGENLEIISAKMDVFMEQHKPGDMLIVMAPQSDLTDTEREQMKSFVEGGGTLMMCLDNELGKDLENFNSILKLYGVSAPQGVIFEGDRDHYALPYANFIVPDYTSHEIVQALATKNVAVLFPYGAGILEVADPLPEENITVSSILETSNSSWMKSLSDLETTAKADTDPSGPFPVGVTITRPVNLENGEAGETRIIAFNTVNHIRYGDSLAAYADGDLVRNCVAWLKGESAQELYIRGKTLGDSVLYFRSASQADWTIALTWPVPVALILIAGLVIFIKRRHL